jgi:hypothetical protein
MCIKFHLFLQAFLQREKDVFDHAEKDLLKNLFDVLACTPGDWG